MSARHRWRWACAALCLLLARPALSMFEEPAPLAVWEDPVVNNNAKKPETWRDKNFGQWCRNFTVNRHAQCPQGSPFHWYYCCGPARTECCAAPQTWTIVVFGSLSTATLFLLVLSLLAHLDLIWGAARKEAAAPAQISVLNKYNPVLAPSLC